MNSIDLSIVTISMNHGKYLKDLLKSLSKERLCLNFEMIMIDNCSTDETRSVVMDNFSWVYLIKNRNIRGFSYNNNKGISLSRGRYILILNPDIVVLPGALRTLVDFMDRNPNVGVCGPKLFNSDKSLQPSCRKYSTPSVLLMRGLRLDLLFRNQKKVADYMMAHIDKNRTQDVDWLMGSALMLRRAALVEAGAFDERFPLYFEDQDLCRRMNENGWRVSYVPQAEMIHHHARLSAKKPLGKIARMHYRSMFYYLFKYYFSYGRVRPLSSQFSPASSVSGVNRMPLPSPPNHLYDALAQKDHEEIAASNP